MKSVYTGGTFDLFHVGHVNLLRKCSELGRVVVSLNTDEFVREFKRVTPTIPFAERFEVLRACKYVSLVIPNIGGRDSKPAISSVNPDYIVIGDDWAPPKDYLTQLSVTSQWLADRAIVLKFIKYTSGVSSTEIRERLRDHE